MEILLAVGLGAVLTLVVGQLTEWKVRRGDERSAEALEAGTRMVVGTSAQLLEQAGRLLTAAAGEKRAAELVPQMVEALNLNTKSLSAVEQALHQLVLQTYRSPAKRERETQVGEEPLATTFGARMLVTTRLESGEEGFVDEATGKPMPSEPRSARALAATDPT